MSKYSNDNEIMININNGNNFSDWVERKYLLSDFQNINLKKLKELIPHELLVHENSQGLIKNFVTYLDSRTTFSLSHFLVVTNRNSESLEELINYVEKSFINSREDILDLINILLQISNSPQLVTKYIKIFNQLNSDGFTGEEMGGLLYSATFNLYRNKLKMIKTLYKSGIDFNSYDKANQNILLMITKSLSKIFHLVNHFSKEECLKCIKKRVFIVEEIIQYILSLPNNKLSMNDLGYNKNTPKDFISEFYYQLNNQFENININEYDSLKKYIQ